MRVVLINVPWARARLQNINKWWGLDFKFDDIVEITVPNVPMQAHPTSEGLAVLDMAFVAKYKKGMTLFIAPWEMPVKNAAGTVIQRRASVNGIFLPPALSLYRLEWFMTRLFWDSPVIEVFANENDGAWQNGVALGPAFELWCNHEFSHWLKWVVKQEDTTHKWFYAGKPEEPRKEILAVLKPASLPPIINTPPMTKTLAQALLEKAKSSIGTDVSPKNLAPQELSCAEGVSAIIHSIKADFPEGVISTIKLKEVLDASPHFKRSLETGPGFIILTPREGDVAGHTGILLEHDHIASNDSSTGKWQDNYTFASWVKYFRQKRGLKHIYIYEPVGNA